MGNNKQSAIINYIKFFGIKKNEYYILNIERFASKKLSIWTNGILLFVKKDFSKEIIYTISNKNIFSSTNSLELPINLLISYLNELEKKGEKVLFYNKLQCKFKKNKIEKRHKI